MEPDARNGAKSGETTQLLRGSAHSETRNGAKSGETVHLLRGNASSAAPVIRRGSATSRVVKNGGSRQESRLLTWNLREVFCYLLFFGVCLFIARHYTVINVSI